MVPWCYNQAYAHLHNNVKQIINIDGDIELS